MSFNNVPMSDFEASALGKALANQDSADAAAAGAYKTVRLICARGKTINFTFAQLLQAAADGYKEENSLSPSGWLAQVLATLCQYLTPTGTLFLLSTGAVMAAKGTSQAIAQGGPTVMGKLKSLMSWVVPQGLKGFFADADGEADPMTAFQVVPALVQSSLPPSAMPMFNTALGLAGAGGAAASAPSKTANVLSNISSGLNIAKEVLGLFGKKDEDPNYDAEGDVDRAIASYALEHGVPASALKREVLSALGLEGDIARDEARDEDGDIDGNELLG